MLPVPHGILTYGTGRLEENRRIEASALHIHRPRTQVLFAGFATGGADPLSHGFLPGPACRLSRGGRFGERRHTEKRGGGCSLADQFYPGRGTPQGRFAPFPSLRSVREPPYRGAEVPQVTDAQEGRD